MRYRFIGNIVLRGKIRVKTGLHIGGSKDSYEIGGIDNPIVKTVKNMPYIPGSSLKGKLRSLLEWKYGLLSEITSIRDARDNAEAKGRSALGYFGDEHPVAEVFGLPGEYRSREATTKSNKKVEMPTHAPTRLVVRDAFIDNESLKEFKGKGLVEIKDENQINRITGTALNPRSVERVPEGAAFNFSMVYSVFKSEGEPQLGDDTEKLEPVKIELEKEVEGLFLVIEALALLEDSYLGGLGSRGSGKVAIEGLEIVVRPASYYQGGEETLSVTLESVRLTTEERQKLKEKITNALKGS